MTEKIKALLENLKSREYRKQRITGKTINRENYHALENQAKLLRELADIEKPILFDNDSFGFNRYTDIMVPGRSGNVTMNYEKVLTFGFDKLISDIELSIQKTSDAEKKQYGKTMLDLLYICLEIAEKYKAHAKEKGNTRLYNALLKIPHKGAESFYEALVFMKLCVYVLRLYGVAHLTLGRFDQYIYPFYSKDKETGISDEEIFETLEEFFISLNYDTDLYRGVQQGDNGQSMVLGGFDKNGVSMYNELSQMCMKASFELSVIDPKINLRVGKNTPDEIYEYATLLTKQGLGFPQYCNDDVVIPGLVKLGYDLDDALNYTVAACWEYIIPSCGADIPNIDTMDFPRVVNEIIVSKLSCCADFDALMTCVSQAIAAECDRMIENKKTDVFPQMPLLSVFMDGCIESLTDMWEGGTKYLNFGCHGAGIANAADALAAVKKNIYDEKTIEKQELLDALAADFEGYSEIRNLLKSSPKMGNNDDYVDNIAAAIMTAFSVNMNNRDNGHGGIWRAGTGSAMEYLRKGEKCPATADGRRSGESYSSSFSPSLDVKTTGLLSVIYSFTKYDMTDIINGGPLTIEIHDTVLRNDIGLKKTAMLVKSFIMLGGHQLQLNSINRERLLDAQMHPEKYPNLITRVWGWSGYFNELDVKYQNHIIRRCEYIL
ncbi:MAG: pyruvate formate-lyase [Clostridia bacterium]|nr:pyruvate formate-lyase [Clostridia bacterium]